MLGAGSHSWMMGKLIRFPSVPVRRPRRPTAIAFEAFNELQLVERAQLKLFGLCACCALIVTGALQFAAG